MLLTQFLFDFIEYAEVKINGMDEYTNHFFNMFDFS